MIRPTGYGRDEIYPFHSDGTSICLLSAICPFHLLRRFPLPPATPVTSTPSTDTRRNNSPPLSLGSAKSSALPSLSRNTCRSTLPPLHEDSPLSLCCSRRLLCLDEQGSHPGLSQVKGESHTNSSCHRLRSRKLPMCSKTRRGPSFNLASPS
ncbi:uncharacterized protein LOC131016436 [Salvia miltiorrhiza]|uniref:uncharacterized protein LOC131016436 n=1 Tax=Salvia miltiorrhiza TaxID=226208 RepID=UPI0025AD4DB7|nr:uncharacterized protein LOC131016436 [Salvia miltiorrhiza]